MHTQNSKKIALLGFAHAHANAYLDVWRQQPQLGVLPVAGWDHDPDRAAAATEKHGLENAASVAEILDRADDAAHPADFLLWLLGMPQSVMAELGTLGNPAIPNDNAIAIFRYANGTFAEISTTFVASAGENVCEVVCEHGTIIANYGDQVSCLNPWPPGAIQLKWFHTADNQWTISDLPDITIQGTRISGLAGPLARFLHGQQPPLATAAEGHQALRMILACYESATTGRRVTFNNPST